MADMPGYDLIIQAYSGLMNLTGEPDGLPLRVGFPWWTCLPECWPTAPF